MDTASLLIDQLTTTFEPGKYEDDYRKKLQELIEAKKAGKDVVTRTEKEEPSNVTDLMEALQRSVDKNKESKTKKKSGKEKSLHLARKLNRRGLYSQGTGSNI